MVRFFMVAVCLFCFGCEDSPDNSIAGHHVSFPETMDAKMPGLLEEFEIPGAALALLQDGEITLLKGYGLADIKTKTLMTPDHIFNLASISKPITAWGVLKLVQEGKVDLDQPVNNYLERWKIKDGAGPAEAVTIRRLLSHTAGVGMPSTPGFRMPMEPPMLIDILEGNYENSTYAAPGTGAEIIYPPGEAFHYSGGGYLILQLMIEDVTGQSFADYMKETVLVPLGMTESQFGWDEVVSGKLATPYYAYDKEEDIFRLPGQAASSLHASGTDMAKWLKASTWLLEKENLGSGVLEADTYRQMFEAVKETDAGSEMPLIGLGYYLENTKYGLLSGHSGGNAGWRNRFVLAPGLGDGFILLTNSDDGEKLIEVVECLWHQRKLKKREISAC